MMVQNVRMAKATAKSGLALGIVWGLALSALAALAGCTGGAGSGGGLFSALSQPKSTAMTVPEAMTTAGSRESEAALEVYKGKDAPLTILIANFDGPQARASAESLRDKVVAAGLKKAFVVADGNEAFLCYGLYNNSDGQFTPEDQQYQADKKQLLQVCDPSGKLLFGRGLTVPLPEATPHSAYDISTATGQYTVMVATFSVYNRKHMATDYCNLLRKKRWPAYVYHGEALSHVTIGSYGNEIFRSRVDTAEDPLLPLSERDRRIKEQFANKSLFTNVTSPDKVVSPEVLRILKTFPLQNLDGHFVTPEEAEQLKKSASIKLVDPETNKSVELPGSRGAQVGVVVSRVVVIPQKVPGGGAMTPMPNPAGSGTIGVGGSVGAGGAQPTVTPKQRPGPVLSPGRTGP